MLQHGEVILLPQWVSLVVITIFIAVLIIILTHKINKAAAALLGSGIVFIFLNYVTFQPWFTGHPFDFETFLEAVEWKTLLLIMGMMINIQIIEESALFQYIALRSVKLTKGSPVLIFILFSVMATFLSSFLTNVTTMLILGRLTISVCKTIEKDPTPYLLTEGIISNVGGIMTSISSIPNILIDASANLGFIYFVINFMPFGTFLMFVTIVYYRWLFRAEFRGDAPTDRLAYIMDYDAWAVVPSRRDFYISAITLGGILVGFIMYPETWLIAMSAAILLLILTEKDTEQQLKMVDWTTIIFFAGFFGIVGGLEYVGLLDAAGESLAQISGGSAIIASLLGLWVSGIASSFVDNIPIAATMIPVMQKIAETANIAVVDPLWWSLVLGTSLGGCLTPIGSPSIVVAISIIEEERGHFSLKNFLKVSSTTTLIYLSLSTVYLLLIWGGMAPIIIPIAVIIIALLSFTFVVDQLRKRGGKPGAGPTLKRIGSGLDKTADRLGRALLPLRSRLKREKKEEGKDRKKK